MSSSAPKKARKVFSGPPKTRSKNGCLTCRKRKKKCDEKGPVCSGCERNYIKCVWPEHVKVNIDAPMAAIPVEEADCEYLDDSGDIPAEMCGVIEITNYKHQQALGLVENVLSLEEKKMYNDLLSYKPQSKMFTSHEKSDALRDLLLAGSSDIANDTVGTKNAKSGATWETLAIQIITHAENKLSLCTRATATDFNIDNLNRNLFNEFLFNYPMLLFFQPSLDICSPFETFQIYNKDYIALLEAKDSTNWANHMLDTLVFQIFECFAKLTWLIRIPTTERQKILGNMKVEVSSIWTTIQTTEIQLDATPSKSSSGENTLRSLGLTTQLPVPHHNPTVEFAKLAYMALQIMYLKLTSPEVDSNTPIVGFYIDQFIRSYEIYLLTESTQVARYMFVFPLVVAACASQTLDQREFISKELYLISYDLKMPFVEKVVNDIEESWGQDFAKGTQGTFNKLIAGF